MGKSIERCYLWLCPVEHRAPLKWTFFLRLQALALVLLQCLWVQSLPAPCMPSLMAGNCRSWFLLLSHYWQLPVQFRWEYSQEARFLMMVKTSLFSRARWDLHSLLANSIFHSNKIPYTSLSSPILAELLVSKTYRPSKMFQATFSIMSQTMAVKITWAWLSGKADNVIKMFCSTACASKVWRIARI